MIKSEIDKNVEPLISIALTTFNGEKYLKEQLESIISQTIPSFEIIVCDDCSSDNTIDILKQYESNPLFQIHYNNRNLGYVKNFEKAINLCNGKYIALSDQDDIWLPHKLEMLVDNIYDMDCIHSDALLVDHDGKVLHKSFSGFTNKLLYPKSILDLLLNGYITGCTLMLSRNFVSEFLPFPENIDAHDRWIGITGFLMGSITYFEQPTIKYRQHSSNNIGLPNYKKPFKSLFAFHYLRRFLDHDNFNQIRLNLEQNYNLTRATIHKFDKELKERNELDKVLELSRVFYDLLNSSKIIRPIVSFLSFFNHYEKNKNLFTRLVLILNFVLKMLLLKISK